MTDDEIGFVKSSTGMDVRRRQTKNVYKAFSMYDSPIGYVYFRCHRATKIVCNRRSSMTDDEKRLVKSSTGMDVRRRQTKDVYTGIPP